jgi:O-antigen/teichoic acid export membrane protein
MVHEKNSKESFVELWRSVLTKSATLIYPIAAFGIINARSIIVLIFSEKYEASTIYLQLITVSSLFSVIIIAPLIYSLGKTKIYSRVHFIIGVITWILGYVVVLVFNSPVAFAVFVVILTIVKSLILIRVVAGILKVKFLALFPVNKFAVLLVHSLIVLFLINTPIQIYGESLSPIVLLGINSLLFPVILVLTGRFVKINYLEVFNSFYRKKGKETAKITQE